MSHTSFQSLNLKQLTPAVMILAGASALAPSRQMLARAGRVGSVDTAQLAVTSLSLPRVSSQPVTPGARDHLGAAVGFAAHVRNRSKASCGLWPGEIFVPNEQHVSSLNVRPADIPHVANAL